MSLDFILSLTKDQRNLLIDTMIDDDGDQRYPTPGGFCFAQKNKEYVDAFRILCTLAGRMTSLHFRETLTPDGKQTQIYIANVLSQRFNRCHVEKIDFHGVKLHPNEPYRGRVWCPETEFGSFVARRNETIFITGNSYNDEMRSHALLQLSQIGLQFDESKSANPFAFYTTSIRNCLSGETVILTREHGAVPIAEVAEQYVTLLDGNGDWVRCHIYDRGVQETQLTFFHGGNQKIGIWSTLEHGWVSDGEIVETQDFVGHNTKIDDLRPRKIVTDSESYQKGVVHGLIYGDGSKVAKTSYVLRVCSHHPCIEKWLQDYSKTYPESANGDPVYHLKNAWCQFKEFPQDPGRDLDYLLGFLRGWFAADGCVSKVPTPTLCGDQREYKWLQQWGPLVGWHLNSYSKLSETTNFGRRKKISLNFHLRKSSMDVDDFLIEQHQHRWSQRPVSRKGGDIGKRYDWRRIELMRKNGMMWKDIATAIGANKSSLASSYTHYRKAKKAGANPERAWHVYGSRQKPARRVERVYCPIVPTTHTFALACGIHTKQCFTRVLNLEKKNQMIRDDLLVMSGAAPSYTRQITNEIEQTALRDDDAFRKPKSAVKSPGDADH